MGVRNGIVSRQRQRLSRQQAGATKNASMSSTIRSTLSLAGSPRWRSARLGSRANSVISLRGSGEGLCRPLTAEELKIVKGGMPEDDCTPAA